MKMIKQYCQLFFFVFLFCLQGAVLGQLDFGGSVDLGSGSVDVGGSVDLGGGGIGIEGELDLGGGLDLSGGAEIDLGGNLQGEIDLGLGGDGSIDLGGLGGLGEIDVNLGGGCNCGGGIAKAGRKKVIKKGKRKVKKRRMWTPSFTIQTLRTNRGRVTPRGKTTSGNKVKVVQRKRSWQQNIPGGTTSARKSTEQKELLQKRLSSTVQHIESPVGLKSVGISTKIGEVEVNQSASPNDLEKFPHLKASNTRFQASSKTANEGSSAISQESKLALGLKNPLAGSRSTRQRNSRIAKTLPPYRRTNTRR